MFKKTAFNRPEHEKIARGILGERFDEDLFNQIQDFMDLPANGPDHRWKRGHNRAAEAEVQRLWPGLGVEMFRIHLWADWIQDHLAEVVRGYYLDGNRPLPYYEGDQLPFCVAQTLRMGIQTDQSGVTILESCCKNCGSQEELTPSRFYGLICKECLEVRQIEVCVNCGGAFCRSLRIESIINEGKHVCPPCAALELQ